MYSLLAALPLVPALVSACRPGEHPHVHRRNPGIANPALFARQLEQTAAPTYASPSTYTTYTDVESDVMPDTECQGYFYPPATALKSSYPTIWQTATIQPNDADAQNLFNSINASVTAKFPDILPRGTGHGGNWTGNNYPATDPDCWWSWHQCTTPAASTGLPDDITTVPEPMTWGLGFDDGPNCSHNALYDYLQQQKQTATMFYIGSNVMDWPLQAQRGLADGHQICVHTWSHQYMTSFSNEEAFAELYYTQKIMKDLLGVTPLCWRPPYGDVDNRIRFIAQQLNMTTIVWSDDTEDWRVGAPGSAVTAQDVTNNYQSIVSGASNGTYATHGPVVLNHELTNFTMSEMLSQYSSIAGAFKHVVPICTAYNLTHPYVETSYTCPDFNTYIGGSIAVSNSTTNTDLPQTFTTTFVNGGTTVTQTQSQSKSSGTAAASAQTSKKSGAGRVASIGATGAMVLGLVGAVMTVLL